MYIYYYIYIVLKTLSLGTFVFLCILLFAKDFFSMNSLLRILIAAALVRIHRERLRTHFQPRDIGSWAETEAEREHIYELSPLYFPY